MLKLLVLVVVGAGFENVESVAIISSIDTIGIIITIAIAFILFQRRFHIQHDHTRISLQNIRSKLRRRHGHGTVLY